MSFSPPAQVPCAPDAPGPRGVSVAPAPHRYLAGEPDNLGEPIEVPQLLGELSGFLASAIELVDEAAREGLELPPAVAADVLPLLQWYAETGRRLLPALQVAAWGGGRLSFVPALPELRRRAGM